MFTIISLRNSDYNTAKRAFSQYNLPTCTAETFSQSKRQACSLQHRLKRLNLQINSQKFLTRYAVVFLRLCGRNRAISFKTSRTSEINTGNIPPAEATPKVIDLQSTVQKSFVCLGHDSCLANSQKRRVFKTILAKKRFYVIPGGALGYFLGGYVPPGTPNWHPVLKKTLLYEMSRRVCPTSRQSEINSFPSFIGSK